MKTYEIKLISGTIFYVELEIKFDIDEILDVIGSLHIEYCEEL